VITLWEHPVTELRRGDRWVSGTEVIEIDAVELNPVVANDKAVWPLGAVRISGRITKGFGAGRKTRHWTFHADQRIDVERP
jgi:hypothetical protein